MLFNSLDYIAFFLVVLVAIRLSPGRHRVLSLLVASYVFYAAWDWRFLSLLVGGTLVDHLLVRLLLQRAEGKARRIFVVGSLVFNLGVLGVFKYLGFFVESFQSMLGIFGLGSTSLVPALVLPLGISFFTFQKIAYVVDVSRGRVEPAKSFLDFSLYVSFFPQLIAGPIEKPRDLMPQLRAPSKVTGDDCLVACRLLLWGFCKKVVVADNLGPKVDRIFAAENLDTGMVILGALGFAFQIYADFSGYTDIGRGSARLLGIRLQKNFDRPFLAANPQEFWRRWHISLSEWLRDYVYIPLGGSRGKFSRGNANVLTTMLLGGLWHGAAWHFVIWGGYHGLLIVGHRCYQRWTSTNGIPGRLFSTDVGRYLAVAAMFMFTLYGWLIFRVDSLTQLAAATKALFALDIEPGFLGSLSRMLPYILLMVLGDFFLSSTARPVVRLLHSRAWILAGAGLILFYIILFLGNFDGNSFIYFEF